MAIVLPHSVFFHIPKTGGTWVLHALLNAGLPLSIAGCKKGCSPQTITDPLAYLHLCPGCKHSHPFSFGDLQGKMPFAFARNPLTYYPSLWRFRMLHGWNIHSEFNRAAAGTTLHEFVARSVQYKPGWLAQRYKFYTRLNDNIIAVGKQEQLADDLVAFLREAGESFDEDALRSTPAENTAQPLPDWAGSSVLDAESEALIRTSESEVFRIYGYR